MKNMTIWLRKYIGLLVSIFGTILLSVLTYGDLGELFTEQYWQNVGGNITSIGALSIGLVMIQVCIKQGLCEQALSAGLNSPDTTKKFEEHKAILNKNREKMIYLPYFLSMRNKRETKQKKIEFLSDNDFTSENNLYLSGNKKLIKRYKSININITSSSIKWSTTDITYSKNGRIEKLDEYRKKRTTTAIIQGVLFMFATVFITGGLFLDPAEIPFWQKTVKLLTYFLAIAITVIPGITKNYEKGAFSVPNELDEVNNIWKEFELWNVPEHAKKEIDDNSNLLYMPEENNQINTEEEHECKEECFNTRRDIQEESEKSENV